MPTLKTVISVPVNIDHDQNGYVHCVSLDFEKMDDDITDGKGVREQAELKVKWKLANGEAE